LNKLWIGIFLFLSTVLWSQDMDVIFPLWENQLTAWMTANPDKTLGDMTPAQAVAILATSRENLIRREFVKNALGASFHMPGAGHFMAGDNLSGGLFITGSALITLAGIWGAVVLLPMDLQTFNPFVYTLDTVEKRLKSHSFMEYLPSLGALGAAGVAHGLLGLWAAVDAKPKILDKAISGKIEFLKPGHNGMLLGAGMKY